MNTETINLVCSVVALAVGLAVFVGFWLKRRRAAACTDVIEVDAGQVVRNYSIYIGSRKVGTCTGASLYLDNYQTLLRFNQIVPMSAPHLGVLQRAFTNRETLNVAVGPVNESVLTLGAMSVQSLILIADMQTGSTKLESSLTGPTLAIPLSPMATEPTQESLAAAFDAIEQRAEKPRQNIAQAL